MTLSVSGISGANHVRFGNKVDGNTETAKINVTTKEVPTDSFEIQHKTEGKPLSKEDKQGILYKARTKAAGWSILGGGISTLYYGLRSDKTIAKKFDLDAEKDKEFIKKIRRDQTLATLPGALVPLGGLVGYIYCQTQNTSQIDVD